MKNIFSILFISLLMVGSFISGSIFEAGKYVKNLDEVLVENQELSNEVIKNSETVDWNALKNIQVGTITDNCKYCSPKVSRAFNALRNTEKRKGVLVGLSY